VVELVVSGGPAGMGIGVERQEELQVWPRPGTVPLAVLRGDQTEQTEQTEQRQQRQQGRTHGHGAVDSATTVSPPPYRPNNHLLSCIYTVLSILYIIHNLYTLYLMLPYYY
jgi:hypothetical protein